MKRIVGLSFALVAIAAGLMVHQFTRWLRRVPTDRDLSVNLVTSEMNVL